MTDAGTAGPPPPQADGGALDLLVRLAGLTVVTLAAVLSGVVEAFLVPLRLGIGSSSTPVPVSLLLALVGNALLVRAAVRVTRSRLAALGPALGWFAPVLVLGNRTAAGDLVVPSSVVGLGLLLVGSAALAGAAFLSAVPAVGGATARGMSPPPPTIAPGVAPDAAPATAAPRGDRRP